MPADEQEEEDETVNRSCKHRSLVTIGKGFSAKCVKSIAEEHTNTQQQQQRSSLYHLLQHDRPKSRGEP